MKEDFLHYLWKFRLFEKNLLTTSGEPVEILKPGEHNRDSGPDFFNAKIKVGETVWAGNVEMHVNASDWNNHGHQDDKAYQNIILHVVHEPDCRTFDQSGIEIPVVELKNKFNPGLWNSYEQLLKSSDWIPCEKMISSVDDFTINNWLERILIERMESKTGSISDLLKQNKNNWEETFYQCLACNFGFKLNSLPFELLAKSLPLKYLGKHKNNLLQIEAMLFGQAGLLEGKFKDGYANELKREYDFLKSKFRLSPIEKHLWKFARTRPVNFPTIRIAQFAMLVYRSSHLLSVILETKKVKDLFKLFDVDTSDYWSSHYRFDKSGKKIKKNLGKSSVENILINTIVPFLFLFGKENGMESVKSKAFEILESLPAEKNQITKKWNSIGMKINSAFHSQAFIQLKNNYCNEKKCLICGIGNKILNRNH